jgi:ribosomal protein S18 acetylase RimI-like enzyme
VEPSVRPFAAGDLDACYDICARTADLGGDARGQYSSDRMLGDLFAVPYATAEPEHAFVVDAGDGSAVGYVVGTADTPRFVRWYRDVWIPATADRMPPPGESTPPNDARMLALHHRPERMLVPELAAYPAHLHIDLLPGWQGKGWGRALMRRLLAALHAGGVPAVHLGMVTANTRARRFYDRLGFEPLDVADAGELTYLGRPTAW